MIFAESQCSASPATPAAQRVSETIPCSPEQGIKGRLPAMGSHMIRELGMGNRQFHGELDNLVSRVAVCRLPHAEITVSFPSKADLAIG